MLRPHHNTQGCALSVVDGRDPDGLRAPYFINLEWEELMEVVKQVGIYQGRNKYLVSLTEAELVDIVKHEGSFIMESLYNAAQEAGLPYPYTYEVPKFVQIEFLDPHPGNSMCDYQDKLYTYEDHCDPPLKAGDIVVAPTKYKDFNRAIVRDLEGPVLPWLQEHGSRRIERVLLRAAN